jgi:hypothetical protein
MQSSVIFACVTSRVHGAISDWMNFCVSCGLLPTSSAPCDSSGWTTSLERKALIVSSCRRFRIGCGVPLGASSAYHSVAW